MSGIMYKSESTATVHHGKDGHVYLKLPLKVSELFHLQQGEDIQLVYCDRAFLVEYFAPIDVPKAKAPPLAPAPEPAPEHQLQSEFGLLDQVGPVSPMVPGAGFFSTDDPESDAPVPPPVAPAVRCVALRHEIHPVVRRSGVPESVYDDDALMEHPAIAGLMLSKNERASGAFLEIIDADGAIRLETPDEKRFRLKWSKPIPPAETATKENLVMPDDSLKPDLVAVAASPVTDSAGCSSPGDPGPTRIKGVPAEVYESDAVMEHPAIPGVMLSRAERVSTDHLSIVGTNGVARAETADEKRFRLKWKVPIPPAETETKKNFTMLNPEYFGQSSTKETKE